MAMENEKPKFPVRKKIPAITFAKDFKQGGEYAHAFGADLYEIDSEVFFKHAVLVKKTQPDVLKNFLGSIENLVRDWLDV